MLVELAIRDFAIVDVAQIQFVPGLNALTGETGAGKSILIDALGAVLGNRVSADLVRTGARSAAIDATFDIERVGNRAAVERLLAELEIETDDGLLILSREIQSGGRSTARLNGRPTTAAILAQVGALLVDIHGQSEHLSLLRPAAQLELLDRFAKVVPERERFAEKLDALRQVRATLADVVSGARERMQRVDLLRFQVEEINEANLRVGEDEELAAERTRLVNAERLAKDAAAVYAAIAGVDDPDAQLAALPTLQHAVRILDEMAAVDAGVGSLRDKLGELAFLLEDIGAEARDYRDTIDADPMRLTEVEERIAELRRLQRKYGADTEEILRYGHEAEAELERLTGSESNAEALATREAELAEEVGELARALSTKRAEAATTLAAEVENAIARLNMGTAAFAVALDRTEDPRGVPVRDVDGETTRFAVDATGIDRATFLIAPNLGEGLKPLSKIASGGETARLMLALKSILSEADQTPTLVFDEIDVGVGGRSGQVVGEMLWDLTNGHQVIAITHLPQIAAFADIHFKIAKTEQSGRVVSTVHALEEPGREEELAAMLDGLPVTASARQTAAEMLERAEAGKQPRRSAG